MLQLIEQETKHPDHKKFGMFALVIMSHGDVGKIYGTDLKQIKLDDVYDRIAAAHFPQMAGKPKMVVIQACSGGEQNNSRQNYLINLLLVLALVCYCSFSPVSNGEAQLTSLLSRPMCPPIRRSKMPTKLTLAWSTEKGTKICRLKQFITL